MAQASSAQESNDISDHMDTVECVCDLTLNSCDSFCCCDSDCTSSIIQKWTDQDHCAMEKFTSFGLLYCKKDGNFFVENSEKDTIDPLFKLLCVQYDNAPDWGRYHKLIVSESDFSTEVITSIIDSSSQYPKNIVVIENSNKNTEYLPGVAIGASYSGSNINAYAYNKYWVIPGPGPNGECTYGSPVFWLSSPKYTSCSVIISDLSTDCTRYMSVKNFVGNVDLVISPSDTSTIITIDLNSALTIKSDGTSSSATSPATSYSSTKCTNALIQADFIVYTDADMKIISKVTADIIVKDIASDTQTVTQKFSVKFFTETDAVSLSGSPGYIKGKPLITATGDESITIQSSFKLYGRSSTGSCSESKLEYSPIVNYGEDTIFSCYYSYTLDQLKTACETSFQDKLIFSQDITYIAKYGDVTNGDTSDDWVSIISSNPGIGVWTDLTKSCELYGILVYDIYYTQVGPYENPQDKIIYVKKYYEKTNWVYKEQVTSTSQKFVLNLVINYIPYQKEDDPYYISESSSDLVVDDVVYVVRVSGGGYLWIVTVFILILII